MCIEGWMHSYIAITLKTLQVIFIEYVCQMFCLYVTLAYILKMPTFKYTAPYNYSLSTTIIVKDPGNKKLL